LTTKVGDVIIIKNDYPKNNRRGTMKMNDVKTCSEKAEKNIHNSVKTFVTSALENVKRNRDVESVRACISHITEEYTTSGYCFNLAMDVFVEAAHKNLKDTLLCILESQPLEELDEKSLDVTFGAYYALSLIFKKENDIPALKGLLDDKYTVLNKYPLRYEVFSRYYKRVDDFRQALDNDKRAINILGRRNIENPAIGISFASTVCSMLRKKSKLLRIGEAELAQKYVDDAISFNPEYPKYYFLKAQLIFYLALNNKKDVDEFEEICCEAMVLMDEYAEVCLYEFYQDQNVFIQSERAKYSEFEELVAEALDRKRCPRFTKSDEQLDAQKAQILSCESQAACSSSYLLPPVPELHEGDGYFFVCYSSDDFKSVYCDLIELYKHKIPFRYDERLTNGLDWKEQVEKVIGDKDCVGVVFYLSKNIPCSEALYDEMDIVEKHKRKYFCVNLEGKDLPSEILSKLIVERHEKDPHNYFIGGKRMKRFLGFFDDDAVFTKKFREAKDFGKEHFDSYVDALTNRFTDIFIGD
jgi:tetratricopeptide (TPR) repeat protein